MPHYHFDIHDDVETLDHEGRELNDDVAARDYAVEAAREMVCSDIQKGRLNLDHFILVRSADGAVRFRLTFRETFIFTGG